MAKPGVFSIRLNDDELAGLHRISGGASELSVTKHLKSIVIDAIEGRLVPVAQAGDLAAVSAQLQRLTIAVEAGKASEYPARSQGIGDLVRAIERLENTVLEVAQSTDQNVLKVFQTVMATDANTVQVVRGGEELREMLQGVLEVMQLHLTEHQQDPMAAISAPPEQRRSERRQEDLGSPTGYERRSGNERRGGVSLLSDPARPLSEDTVRQ